MPQQDVITREEFTRRLRERFPDYRGTDDALFSRYQIANPVEVSEALGTPLGPPLESNRVDPNWVTTGLTTGARVGLPIVGGVAGSIFAPVTGPVGPYAGMVGGGIAGEAIAQGIEQFLGQRDEFNPYSIGISGAMGLIPGAKPIAATLRGPALAQALKTQLWRETGKGAGFAGVGDIGFQLAEKKTLDPFEVDPFQTLGTTLMGAGMGAGMQRLFQTGARSRVQQPTVSNVELDVLQDTIEGAKAVVRKADRKGGGFAEARDGFKRLYVDRLNALKSTFQKITGNDGVAYPDASPVVDYDLAGGAGKKIEAFNRELDDLTHSISYANYEADVQQLLNLRGYRRGSEDLSAKLRDALEKNNVKKILEYAKKLEEGGHLPVDPKTGKPYWTAEKVDRALSDLETGLRAKGRWQQAEGFVQQYLSISRRLLDEVVREGELLPKEVIDNLLTVRPQARQGYGGSKRGPTGRHKKTGRTEGQEWSEEKRSEYDWSGAEPREYVPLLRIMEALGGPQYRARLRGGSALPVFEGSERLVMDPWESIRIVARNTIMAAEENKSKLAMIRYRNSGLRSVMKDGKVIREQGPVTREGNLLRKVIKSVKPKKNPETGQIEWKVPKDSGDETFNVLVDGKQRTYAADAPIAAAINHLDEDGNALLGELWLNLPARITSRFATSMNVAFSVSNFIRDNVDLLHASVILGELDAQRLGGYVSEMLWVLKDTLHQEGALGARRLQRAAGGYGRMLPEIKVPKIRGEEAFTKAGAGFSGQARQTGPQYFLGRVSQGAERQIGETTLDAIDTVLRPFARFSGGLEDATKITTFNTLKKRGYSDRQAAWLTRKYGGSPDFAVRGTASRHAGSMVLFFNAQVQGIDRNVKMIKAAASHPGKAAILLGTIAGLELLRSVHNDQYRDPDGTRSYDRITKNDRENYWVFLRDEMEVVNGVPRHKSFKFSKGHLAKLMYNPISDVIEGFGFTEQPEQKFSPTDTAIRLAESFVPGSFNIDKKRPGWSALEGGLSSLNPILKVPAELIWNRRTYSGDVPIEPRRLEGLATGYRATDRTSPALARLGRMLEDSGVGSGISPTKMEHAIRSMLPGPGEQALKFADEIVSGTNPFSAFGTAVGDPIARRFRGSEGDQVVRDLRTKVYGAIAKMEQVSTRYRQLQVEEPGNANAFYNKNLHIFGFQKFLRQSARWLGTARGYTDEALNASQQRAALEHASNLIDQMKAYEQRLKDQRKKR